MMICAPLRMASANSCTWVLCMFSPRWLPMRTRHRAFSMSVRSGEPTPAAEGEVEAHVPGAAALGVGGRGDVGGAVGVEEVLHPVPAVPVGEEGQGLGAVLVP